MACFAGKVWHIDAFLKLYHILSGANFMLYRVFELGLYENKHLLGYQKCTFRSLKLYLYIHEMRTFDLWHLDLVENNIPVLHSLSPERVPKIHKIVDSTLRDQLRSFCCQGNGNIILSRCFDVHISWIYRYSFYDFKVHLLWPNKFLVWLRSSLNTL